MNNLWANLIIEELIRRGVDYFCISPGSRSTPLVVAAARNDRAKTIICYDERAAGFHAVGYARATGKPAAVITTSGTAVANLLPAITEADRDDLPLIALTADRPQEFVDAGANQTIVQPGIFGSFTRFDFDMPFPEPGVPLTFVLTAVDAAVNSSQTGPVHINCRFPEPLNGIEEDVLSECTDDISDWQNSTEPFTALDPPILDDPAEVMDLLIQIVKNAETGLLVIGKLNCDKQRQACIALIDKLNWPVYADITSGLRLTHCKTNIIRHFDQQLQNEKLNNTARPYTVIHIGGRVVSKRLPQFIIASHPENYIVIKPTPVRLEHINVVTEHIQADIALTVYALADSLAGNDATNYGSFYNSKADRVNAIIAENIDAGDSITEPFIARQLTTLVPDDTALFLSSSMPIRDVDLYGITGRNNITVGANRGVSGIDGVIASACGFAAAKKTATTLLIGDLAFIHDINSLSLLSRIKPPVVIVVINNRGGGIFHFLPIVESTDVFEEYFATPHDHNFRGVCDTFGIDYHNPTDKKAFIDTYNTAIKNAKPAVIEIATGRSVNLTLRRKMKNEILNMLQE